MNLALNQEFHFFANRNTLRDMQIQIKIHTVYTVPLSKEMDAAAEIGRNPVSTRFSLSMEISSLTRDGTAETVSQDQTLRCERGQGNV